MQLTYVAVVILASMVFVLSGMVGYLYWQQTRMLQHLQSLATVVAQVVHRPEPAPQPAPEPELEDEDDLPPLVPIDEVAEDDDRLSVEKVEGPPAPAPAPAPTPLADDLDKKTAAELRDLLTSRSIPFGKRDSKPVLLQLLKATA
jgi:hypothetical protein